MLNIRKMRVYDLKFFLKLRNSNVKFLHNKALFSYEECLKWFVEESPLYFIIEKNNISVGYIRTSNETQDTIYIGADILPKYRRQGIASAALMSIMCLLQKNCYYLEVLDTNTSARKLYDKLGFTELSTSSGSTLMKRSNPCH